MIRAIDIISEDRKKVVQNIIERIEKDGLEWKKGWSPEMVAPTNPSSKAEYKGRNVVKAFNSALNNEYKDPRWITFKQSEKEGWKVKKGAKSIVLEKWIFDKEEKKLNPETGKEEKIKMKLDRPVPNYFRVFNGQDIEGMPPLNIRPLDKNKTLEIAENIIKSSKVPVVEIAQPRAYHSSSENRIIMPLRDTFKSQESYLATALHEMVHSTGKELERDLSGKFGGEKYAKEELVAELGSLMLQGKLGIKLEGRQVDNHAAYLKSWVKVLKNDSNELFRAAEKAEKASELLYGRYQEYIKEHIKEVKDKNLEVNKIYAYTLEGLKDGKELTLIAKDELNEKGIANVYNESKKLWRSKDRENSISKAHIFGIDDKGKFYHRRPDQINFEDSKTVFAKDTLESGKNLQEMIKKENLKEYSLDRMDILDKAYNLNIRETFEKINLKEKEISIENKKGLKISEEIKNSIKENPYISTSEISKKYNLDEKKIKEELSSLIKNKEVFYQKENGEEKRFVDKEEFIKSIEAQKIESVRIRKENKKRIENIMKEIANEPVPRGNYNILTGNEVITPDHLSGDKRWITVNDVRKNNIGIKENEKPTFTIITHKEEEKLYVKPVEYYNVSQLEITREVEQQFKPMKEKVIEKSQEKGQGIGD